MDTTQNGHGLPVRVLNESWEDVQLKKDTVLGVIEEVVDCTPSELNEVPRTGPTLKVNRVSQTGKLPCHIQDLFDRSAKTLSDDRKRNCLNF